MNIQEQADKLYLDAYNKWCNELSHDKNHLQAKDIAIYVCNLILDYKCTIREYEDWKNIKKLIEQK